jgi:hypothetical protein
LEPKVPDPLFGPIETLWYNMAFVEIPEEIKGNIFIYVMDALGVQDKKFKFEVIRQYGELP